MFTKIKAIGFFTLLEAVRHHLIWLIVGSVLTGILVGQFVDSLAITESVQIQNAIIGAMFRFIAVIIVTLFVVSSVAHDFSDKTIELLLATAITRTQYFIGKAIGLSGVAVAVALAFGVTMSIYSYPDQVMFWTISLLLELLIVMAFSFLCAISLLQIPIALFSVLLFYLMSRTIGAIVLMANSPFQDEISFADQTIFLLIDGIRYLLPNLDHFTKTEWLVYGSGDWSQVGQLAIQSLVYMLLLFSASLFDLHRKNL